MGLDIFFLEDIRNAIQAANEASSATAALIVEVAKADAPDSVIGTLRAYRKGYKAALTTLALAFGLSPAIVGGMNPLEMAGALPISAPPPGCAETSTSPIGDCTTEEEE